MMCDVEKRLKDTIFELIQSKNRLMGKVSDRNIRIEQLEMENERLKHMDGEMMQNAARLKELQDAMHIYHGKYQDREMDVARLKEENESLKEDVKRWKSEHDEVFSKWVKSNGLVVSLNEENEMLNKELQHLRGCYPQRKNL